MAPVSILYEDDEILLINKKDGVPVQGGVNIFHPLDETLSEQLGYKVHLVHRLDKETSGLLVVAKNPVAAAKWTRLIGEKQVKKEYLAVCVGLPVVNGHPCMKGVLKDSVNVHGRTLDASLDFNVLKTKDFEIEKDMEHEKVTLSLVHIVLGTGRMHQIRIQLAKAQAPLAADDKHGNFHINKLLRKAGIKKMCLTAFRLTLPLKPAPKTFEISAPEYFPL